MKDLSLLLRGESVENAVTQKKVSKVFQERIEELEAEERYKTALSYRCTRRAIIKVVGDVSVSDFNKNFLKTLYRSLKVKIRQREFISERLRLC